LDAVGHRGQAVLPNRSRVFNRTPASPVPAAARRCSRHRTEATPGHPVRTRGDDVLVGAADDVPPHGRWFVEGLTAEQEQPDRTWHSDRNPGAAGAEVEQRTISVARCG
jgi:hypothetical protein